MKQFLKHRSRREGFCGWALQVKGDEKPLAWTTCTTRAECRELREETAMDGLRRDLDVVKVRITVTAIDAEE